MALADAFRAVCSQVMPETAVSRAAFGSPPPSDWDDWLAACGRNAGFCQTSERAEIVHARRGAVSYVLTVEKGGVRLAGALLSLIPPEPAQHGWARRSKAWITGRGKGELLCAEGPVLAAADKPSALAELLARVDELATRAGIGSIRFAGKPVLAEWGEYKAIAAVFRRFGYQEKPWMTSLVDLTAPEDTLYSGFKHAVRKGIRKCANAGLTVGIARDYEEFRRDFLQAYFEGDDPDSAHDRERPSDRDWWRIDGGRHYRFFIAKDQAGAVHATLGTYAFNGLATEIMSGRTAVGKKANLPAQDLLHWEAFRFHRSIGDTAFNLAGYNPAPRNPKESGIKHFTEAPPAPTVNGQK